MATASTGTFANVGESSGKTVRVAFALVTSLFFIFGFITCLNDILVPHLKSLFTLNYTQAALIQFCFFSAYFVASIPSGKVVTRMGYKQGTVLGLLITALGCVLFYPAAGHQSYDIFLVGLFILAAGITLIQVAVNPYIAVLGPSETSSARLTLAQAFNSLGTTLAPMFGSYLILANVTTKTAAEVNAMSPAALAVYRAGEASSVQGPYVGLAIALGILALAVALFPLPTIRGTTQAADDYAAGEHLPSAWHYRHLVLGAIGIFCYVGAEVAIGSYLVNFMGLPEIAGLPQTSAANYVSLYWGGAMVGRFIGSAVMRKINPGSVLAFNAAVAGVLVFGALLLGGHLAMYSILAVGLFNSIMFPTIFTLAIKGLGKNTAQGSGILCAAIVGGAVIPLIQGRFADLLGLHHSYLLPIACYGFIVFYGLKGHRVAVAETGRPTEFATV